jgi:hypothetical protein
MLPVSNTKAATATVMPPPPIAGTKAVMKVIAVKKMAWGTPTMT